MSGLNGAPPHTSAFDLPLSELEQYHAPDDTPPDFDDFWHRTLDEASRYPTEVEYDAINSGLRTIDTYNLTYAGYGGDPIRAWLHKPTGATGPLPVVIEFPGYGGGRGLPHQNTLYASAGYAHMVVDVRGQGSWARGNSPDPHAHSQGQIPGFMTRGIDDPSGYYYRRVFVDAIRAIESLRQLPCVDAERVIVAGYSQGGGISLAAGGLSSAVVGVMSDVPFLCNFTRAVALADRGPYPEIVEYLARYREQAPRILKTLRYFDGISFAARSAAPALFSVALRDHTCPPSTVYAAYNAYRGPKRIVSYAFNDHEGGGEVHERRRLDWLSELVPLG